MTALASRLIQAAWMIPTALFLGWWAYQAVRPLVARRRGGRHPEHRTAPTVPRHGEHGERRHQEDSKCTTSPASRHCRQ